MKTYTSKEELKSEIAKSYARYIAEFADIPENMKTLHIDEVERTPAENLGYQVTLILKWEYDERKGIKVKTPSVQKSEDGRSLHCKFFNIFI